MTGKRVLIAAGGTGGHLFPAQALATEMIEMEPEVDLLFMGAGLAQNRYFQRGTFPFVDIPSATFSFRKPWQLIRGLPVLWRGIRHSAAALRTWQPDIVVGFGSFITLPVMLAAWRQEIPLLIHEQNCLPGKVNRLLSRVAQTTGVFFPDARHRLHGRVEHVAMPLRPSSIRSASEARQLFGLDPDKPTLLLFGGSQGAQFFNQWLEEVVHNDLFPRDISLQVIHITGEEEAERRLRVVYQQKGISAYVRSFLLQMGEAWRAADFFIGRAGASTIAESLAFRTPGILIPFPFATEDHQYVNGRFLSEKVGSGIVIRQSEVTPASFPSLVAEMMPTLPVRGKRLAQFHKEWQPRTMVDWVRGYL